MHVFFASNQCYPGTRRRKPRTWRLVRLQRTGTVSETELGGRDDFRQGAGGSMKSTQQA